MENKRFEHIITRYLKGKATPEEEAELLQAIHVSKEWEAAFRKRTAEWNPLEETEADYFVNDEHYTVTEVDSERLTSWRKGIIFYDNASLDEIVRLIEQTYKVSLIYTRPENDDQRFSGAFLKTQKLETVLQQTNKLTGTNLILIQ